MNKLILFLLFLSSFSWAETKAYIYSGESIFQSEKASGLYIDGRLARDRIQLLLGTLKENSMSHLMRSNPAAYEAALNFEENYRYEFISTVVVILTAIIPKPANDSDRNLQYTVGSLSFYAGAYFKVRADHFYYKAINLYNGGETIYNEVAGRRSNNNQMNLSFFSYSF